MKVKSIVLEHTNPSLGPHEEIITVSLSINEANAQRVTEFFKQSEINGKMLLLEFLEATKNGDTEITGIIKKDHSRPLGEGGTISNLTFYLDDGQQIVLKDIYRRYHLSHFYPDFTKYMLENGSRDTYGPGAPLIPRNH